MHAGLRPDELQPAKVIWFGMFAASLLWLGVASFMRAQLRAAGGLEVLSYLAVGWALAAPLLASMMRERILAAAADPALQAAPQTSRSEASAARRALIVSLGLLEAPAMFCGIALMVGPNDWPLYAALVPLGAMVLAFPRAG